MTRRVKSLLLYLFAQLIKGFLLRWYCTIWSPTLDTKNEGRPRRVKAWILLLRYTTSSSLGPPVNDLYSDLVPWIEKGLSRRNKGFTTYNYERNISTFITSFVTYISWITLRYKYHSWVIHRKIWQTTVF